ncbi:MAG: N-acetylmuramoyl-L-alanine amidase [Candidatus Solibacter usitatus]|nr:N-acetylmuramoyl-L-alanine amidase [Candidatus Solibacter usitatus]
MRPNIRSRTIAAAWTMMLIAMTPLSLVAADHMGVTAVRFWSISDATRIAIETTGPFKFVSARLESPARIYFDIKDARPQLSKSMQHVIAVKDSRIKQIRVAETSPGTTRIVMDLEEGALDIQSSQLDGPNRLMIEVKGNAVKPSFSAQPSVAAVHQISRRTLPPSPPAKPFDPPPVLGKTAPLRNLPMQAVSLPPAPAEPERVHVEPVTLPEVRKQVAEKKTEPKKDDSLHAVLSNPPPIMPPSLAQAAESGYASRPATRNSNGDRSLTRALGLKIRRVVIDPGHGGHDHGTTGAGGLTEKELVLDVSRRLGALITEGLGSEVIFTRTTDDFITLEDRTAFANSKKADLFLSIHANASPYKAVGGVETYYLSLTTSRAAMDLASRENASSQKSISDLRDLLQKIALRDTIDESREFAVKVQHSLTSLLPPATRGTQQKDRGVKRAPFIVLIGAKMPAILTEVGFVTNTREEVLLKKPEYRQKVAQTIYRGLQQYAESLSKIEVAQSAKRTDSE